MYVCIIILILIIIINVYMYTGPRSESDYISPSLAKRDSRDFFIFLFVQIPFETRKRYMILHFVARSSERDGTAKDIIMLI